MRETLGFAARVQGTGHKAAELCEFRRREAAAGIKPDAEIEAFMNVRCSVCY